MKAANNIEYNIFQQYYGKFLLEKVQTIDAI